MYIQKNQGRIFVVLLFLFTFILNVNAQESNTELRYQKGEELYNKEEYKK
jgi:hypothetical protein